MFNLIRGAIKEKEPFYIFAKIRDSQSANLLNSVNTSVNHDTLFFLCNNYMDNGRNLFYFSCDPEDFFVNRKKYCNANGAVEFTYKDRFRLKWKNNIHHTTGYINQNSFTQDNSVPPGEKIIIRPSPEYHLPSNDDIHQGPAYDIKKDANIEVNFYFRKNTSKSGTSKTFSPLVKMSGQGSKFVKLNRSYVKFTTSDYTSIDTGIRITTAANAAKINFLRNGILYDANDNYFDYTIIDNSKEVHIIGTAKYNSTTVGASVDKTGDIFFILGSDLNDSFTTLQTLIGDDYTSTTQYLDFYFLKKKSYGSGGNKHMGHGHNTSSSTNKFYSISSGTRLNPLAYGAFIHFINTYISTSNSPVNNYVSLKTSSRNTNPAPAHAMFSTLHESTLAIPYSYAKNGQVGRNIYSAITTQPTISYSSVESYSQNGEIFQDATETKYNPIFDYIFAGGLIFVWLIIAIVIISIFLSNNYNKSNYNGKSNIKETRL